MNTYHIKVDGQYFTRIDEEGEFLVGPKEMAKVIEGNFNLKSYMDKIYQAIRYGNMEFRKIEIVRVKNESSKTL